MLIDDKPIGIVSIHENVIKNLYVLPSQQNKGYGTQLLDFAIKKCTNSPSLWILSSNNGAKRFYKRNEFKETGNIVHHSNGVCELELCLCQE